MVGHVQVHPSFNVHITGNNAQPTSFSLTDGVSQPITLDSGPFTVREGHVPALVREIILIGIVSKLTIFFRSLKVTRLYFSKMRC